MVRRKFSMLVPLALAVIAGALTVEPSTAGPPPSSTAAEATSALAGTVTLITGDKVTIIPRGKSWDVKVEPARRLGTPDTFVRQVTSAGVTVIPARAIPLIRSKTLDPALFDITGLIRQNLDDKHAKAVPLLVQATNRRTAATFGKVTRALGDSRLTAVSADRPIDLDTVEGTRVWLNARAKPVLDVSVPQVGAPAAWAAGHTAAGVKVAVLDTGYDPDHPDLRGVVSAEKDFIQSAEGVRDTDGHGTHVASTAAGRGTASGGRYTGVAKGADLMVGKVCDWSGCPYDAIIAGMQWAATNGAKVVNLSLGGYPTDGTDPLSTELNRLTASTGTLFVVAAGNKMGDSACRVTTPATADAALAVSSVTKQDTLSDFSCGGPRNGDYAMKPELVAPGSDIVAARAAGTLPGHAVDQHHARLSGTSMAAPHVAGAAAILAGQHPDWDAAKLKRALMASARPVEANVYQQGAGRLDLARAITQPVSTETGSVGFGKVLWPFKEAPNRQQQLTYRNDSAEAITLNLALDVRDSGNRPAPAGLIGLSATTVSVPARGVTSVKVDAAPSQGEAGTYGGRVVATSPDGKVVVQTPVGIDLEPESYNLKVLLTDRQGAPPGPDNSVMLLSLDDPELALFGRSGDSGRFPTGRYLAIGNIYNHRPAQGDHTSITGAMEINLGRDTVATLDGRTAKRQYLGVEAPDARMTRGLTGIGIASATVSAGMISSILAEHYVIPLAKGPAGFVFYTRAVFDQPWARVTSAAGSDVPVDWFEASPSAPPGTQRLRVVDAGRARPEDLAGKDLRGALASFTLTTEDEGSPFDQRVAALKAAGAAAVLFHYTDDVSFVSNEVTVPVLVARGAEGAQLAGQTVMLRWTAGSPYHYEFALPHHGRIPAVISYQPRNSDLAAVQSRFDSAAGLPGATGWTYQDAEAGELFMDGDLRSSPVRLPSARIDYFTPGPVSWRTYLAISLGTGGHTFRSRARTYRAGDRATAVWNKPVVGPEFDLTQLPSNYRKRGLTRSGDTLTAVVPLFSDPTGRTGLTDAVPDRGSVVLTQDGKELGRSEEPGRGVFTLPSGDHRYTLTAEARRDDPGWPLATKVVGQWDFRSASTAKPEDVDLPTVGIDPPVDRNGRAPAGRKFTFPLTAGSATVRSVEVSYDDGAHWQPAQLHRSDAGWRAVVDHPASGFVSLRVHATDPAGSEVHQTTIRAYGLK